MRTSRAAVTKTVSALVLIAIITISSVAFFLAGQKAPLTSTSTSMTSVLPTSTYASVSSTSSVTSTRSNSSEKNGPEIWFTPYPHTPAVTCTVVPISNCPGVLSESGRQVTFNGSVDYMQLFTNESAWATVRNSVNVFGVSIGWMGGNAQVPQFINDSTLSLIFSKLNQWGIKLATEAGPLQTDTPTRGCGVNVEGFGAQSVKYLKRINSLGGVVTYIPLDEPYYYGTIYSGNGACGLTPLQAGTEVMQYASAARQIFPSVEIGDEEPLHGGLNSVSQLEGWIETYKNVSGHYFSFFHLDVSWASFPNWPDLASQLQSYCEQRGIRFGVLFNGIPATTDRSWLGSTENRVVQYVVVTGRVPDNVVFMSWVPWPRYVLPETSSDSFTHLIDLFLRQRTSLNLNSSSIPTGETLSFGGSLIESRSGQSIANGAIDLRVTALSGDGLFSNYEINGTFPQGTNSAILGVRVNTECGCDGVSAFNLYNVSLMENKSTKNLVPNYDFGLGLKFWYAGGNATSMLTASDSRAGYMLSVLANRSTAATLNSAPINVAAGANFSAVFGAKVAPITSGSGYFFIIFLGANGKETSRETLPIEPATLTLAQIRTNSDGEFSLTWRPPTHAGYLISFYYEGDDEHWPAYASLQLPSDVIGINLPFEFPSRPWWAQHSPTLGALSSQYQVHWLRTPVYLTSAWNSSVYDPALRNHVSLIGILEGEFLLSANNTAYIPNWTLSDWHSLIGQAVAAYPAIHVWEVWNEAELQAAEYRQFHETGYFNGSAYQYFLMLKDAYGTIKAHNPTDTVVCFGGLPLFDGIPHQVSESENFARQVWNYGASRYCDAISVHAYSGMLYLLTDVPSGSSKTVGQIWNENLQFLENLTAKPVWVDETGLPSNNWTSSAGLSPQKQSLFLEQSFSFFLSKPYVKAVLWWDLIGPSPESRDLGLFYYNNGNPKPALLEFEKYGGG